MNTMKWLVKREFWEHKGGFFWAPIVVGAIMTFFITATMFTAVAMGTRHGFSRTLINGRTVSTVTDLSTAMTAEQLHEGVIAAASGYMGLSAPLFMVMAFVVFFFCLGTLFDERRDRSVLFWKSLPISDSATVLSKVAIALVVAPLITLAIATLMSLLLLVLGCIAAAMSGVHVGFQIFSTPALYLAPFQIAAMIPVYVLWALPTVGWLLMVSAWARTKPFLWAVGVPVLVGALLSWFNAMFNFGWNIAWFWQNIVMRGLLSAIPGAWFTHPGVLTGSDISAGIQQHSADMGTVLAQSWQVLATPDAWIGIAAGAAMIYAAIRLRRWRDEG
jgi:ABC-2 type transport system permease protein